MNVDPLELQKFGALAHRWWDPAGEFAPLHQINPLRLAWIERSAALADRRVLDVGCGGGILAEAMAARGARVKGIDLSDRPLAVARLHLLESRLPVEYEKIAAEDLAVRTPAGFEVLTCMEMLEHVPDPAQTVVACAALAAPGGRLFFSTINRNLKSYLFAIIGAEYVLKLLPHGTHDYARFIRPAELSRICRRAGLEVREIAGMSYNPFSKSYSLGADVSVNYLLHACKPQ
ncbi:MAG: bifunctional 2-polyprenyl-6-hydroxyphenol methylase/3-demethylubiquinol 3-O-methyltransferase UbiG [Burkholderiales bacterium]|nr:bifunctional 2-polyprenyl-6-hydroxyphenol methylase/3-demethylubiquinol 3-O-methyltransferase UbiG [Burkholderiales bacterium]